MAAPEVVVGQRADALFLTKTVGPVILGMNDTVELAPDITQKKVSAVQALDPNAIFNVYAGGTGKISQTETQALQLLSLLQDLETNPGTSPAGILNDLRNLRPFSLLVNKKPDEKDTSFGFMFAYDCL